MQAVLLPTSFGDAADRMSILQIKTERISDPAKLSNVERELQVVSAAFHAAVNRTAVLDALLSGLKAVNEKLWEIEDEIRDCERTNNFGDRFVQLARSVYVTNDERAQLKRRINEALGSSLIEEKSYKSY
jgi:hypothetical protein